MVGFQRAHLRQAAEEGLAVFNSTHVDAAARLEHIKAAGDRFFPEWTTVRPYCGAQWINIMCLRGEQFANCPVLFDIAQCIEWLCKAVIELEQSQVKMQSDHFKIEQILRTTVSTLKSENTSLAKELKEAIGRQRIGRHRTEEITLNVEPKARSERSSTIPAYAPLNSSNEPTNPHLWGPAVTEASETDAKATNPEFSRDLRMNDPDSVGETQSFVTSTRSTTAWPLYPQKNDANTGRSSSTSRPFPPSVRMKLATTGNVRPTSKSQSDPPIQISGRGTSPSENASSPSLIYGEPNLRGFLRSNSPQLEVENNCAPESLRLTSPCATDNVEVSSTNLMVTGPRRLSNRRVLSRIGLSQTRGPLPSESRASTDQDIENLPPANYANGSTRTASACTAKSHSSRSMYNSVLPSTKTLNDANALHSERPARTGDARPGRIGLKGSATLGEGYK